MGRVDRAVAMIPTRWEAFGIYGKGNKKLQR